MIQKFKVSLALYKHKYICEYVFFFIFFFLNDIKLYECSIIYVYE